MRNQKGIKGQFRLAAVLLFCYGLAFNAPADWRVDFSKITKRQFMERWHVKRSIGVPVTQFQLRPPGRSDCLSVTADRATGALITTVKIDLNRTPIMRWCWRVNRLPRGADGRNRKRDDQAIAIYVGVYRGLIGQNTIAYRWETDTPLHTDGSCRYLMGAMRVRWFCLRNKEDKLGEWHIEERNIAADFKRIYGIVPKKFALSIAANSQYTKSSTSAEVAWIEFTAPAKKMRQTGQVTAPGHYGNNTTKKQDNKAKKGDDR